MRFEDLARSSNRELEANFRSASRPDVGTLVGQEWRGFNMSPVTRLLGIQKFVKGFYAIDDRVEGYNVPAVQNGLLGPWIHRPSPERPRRYAFFVVSAVDPRSRDHRYRDALLLDYSASTHDPRLSPARLLRDYLAQPDPADPDLLLGKAYFALGPARVRSNFFVIERLRPTDRRP